MESDKWSQGEMRNARQLLLSYCDEFVRQSKLTTVNCCFPGQERPLEGMEAVHAALELSKAMDVTESHAETESDLETVGSKHLPTKRAGGIMEGSTKPKIQKKSDIKMSVEELFQTKGMISNAIITAVREMRHDVYKGDSSKKKIQTSSPLVFEMPSFGSGMQVVENHGTQKQIKLEKLQIGVERRSELTSREI